MNKFKRNLLSVYTVNATNGILGLIAVPLGVKFLGISGYGLYSIYGVLAAFIMLIDLGVTKNLIRFLASGRGENVQSIYLRATFGLYFIIALVMICILPGLLYVVPKYLFHVPSENLYALKLIVAFAVLEYIIAIPTTIKQTFCMANEHFDRYSKFIFVSGLYKHFLMFFGFYYFRLPEVVVGLVAARRFIDLFTSSRLMGALPSESWYPDFNRDKLKSIAGYSAALTVPQLIQSTIYALGSILVNKYFGLSALGRYRAAYDIANRVWFFSNGMSLVIFPKFSRILSEAVARERFLPRITAYLEVSWAGYNLLSIVGILLASKLLGFMGLTHRDTGDLFVLLILGASLFAHATLSNEFLQAAGKFRIITILNTLALLVMGASFFILYKKTAILSMGWAWICSQGIYASLSDVMVLYISSFPCKVQFNLLMSKLVILTCSLAVVAGYFRVLPTVIQFVSLTIVLLCTGWSIYRLWPALRLESNGNSV